MFRDECEIEVAAGRGGDGLVSFRREKSVPLGGPDGGDGGDGGDVVLVASGSVSSLLEIGRRPRYRAKDGAPGGPRLCAGKDADDLALAVPVGTQVFDAARGNLLSDLALEDARVVIARGGRGGRGNVHFKSSVHQAPRIADTGRPGEARRLRLVLKLVAEVGLLGLPNAGKSTFLSAVSAAHPKVADYPFTTLVPEVGIAPVGDFDTLCIADLPGLIEGAAEGVGLGHQFLRHVERCRVLLHLVDVSVGAVEPPERAHAVLDAELSRYSKELARRPRIVVATKCEDEQSEHAAAELERALGLPVRRISSHTGRGVPELLAEARRLVREVVPAATEPGEPTESPG